MEIEVELPREIELLTKANKYLDALISKIFDTLLKRSDLSDDDVNKLNHMMKREIMEELGWR
jgi:hypothetical protein